MKSDGQAILRMLLPALLVVAACGSPKAPGVTTAGTAGAGGAAGTSGVAGASGGDAGGAGAGGDAGASGTAGDSAAGGAGSTGTAGVPADDSGPDGGAGTYASSYDGPPNPEGGTVLPPYDRGIVNVINAGNWNETTIHPFTARRMLLRDVGEPHLVLLDFGRTTPLVWKTVAGGPWARGIQLIGNGQVLGGRNDGYEVFDLTTGDIVKSVRNFPSTQSAYRMANGETMLTQNVSAPAPATGQITLSFLDKTDRISHAISYPGFSYVRMVRPTRNKTFLVPSDTTLFEGDASGNILWTATGTGWGHIWEALLMSDGNVLLATFFGSSLDVVDRNTHMVTKRFGTKTMPNAAMFKPIGFAEFQILPNGNLITANWQGNGTQSFSGIQVIEFSPAGDVAWFYKQDPQVFSTIEGVMVIDGMDPRFLHAQEISPDSTWQPVIPTP
jgi:hypothetical protein